MESISQIYLHLLQVQASVELFIVVAAAVAGWC